MRQTAELGQKVNVTRVDAREVTIELLRELEGKVREALSGSVLRGLGSLLPPGCARFPAARVHGNAMHGIASFLPADGRPALVWTSAGVLGWAWKSHHESAAWRPAHDEELAAQDLLPALRALRDALAEHVRRSERAADDYLAVADLARRLEAALAA